MTDGPINLPEGEHAFLVKQDGKVVGFSQLMKERGEEADLSIAGLRPKDLIAFAFRDEEGGEEKRITFDISRIEWRNIGVSGSWAPSPTLYGRLDGASKYVSDDDGKEVIFGGSGWGGSMRRPGFLGTGMSAYFYLPGRRELRTPAVSVFDVLQRNNDESYTPLTPNQLDRRSEKNIDSHDQSINKAEALMKKLGFDKFNLRDGTPIHDLDQSQAHYYDGRFEANYIAGGAMGNQLAIIDYDTGLWFETKYFAFEGEDFMQRAFADLSAQDLSDMFYGDSIVFESSIHASGVPIVTFTTGGRYGINAVNYKMGDEEAQQIYGINQFDPNIEFWPDGEVRVPLEYPFTMEEDKNPGLKERIEESASITTEANGNTQIVLKDNKRTIKNPDKYMDFLLTRLKGAASNRPYDPYESLIEEPW